MSPVVDPEFKSLIPPLTEDERKGLEEDIKREGCRTPIIVWDGFVIDGHNRLEICTEHKIAYGIEERRFESREEVRAWMLRNQLNRRNLTKTQRMDLALVLKDELALAAKKRQGTRTDIPENLPECQYGDARDEAAKFAGVSGRTLDKYEAVKEEGVAELLEATRTGSVSVDAAAKTVKHLSKEEQLEYMTQLPGDRGEKVRRMVEEAKTKEKESKEWEEFINHAHADRPKSFDPNNNREEARLRGMIDKTLTKIAGLPPAGELLSGFTYPIRGEFQELDAAAKWITEFANQLENHNEGMEISA